MIGVLCIHGFTGSPKEVEPLVHFLKKHTDWLVKAPTLPGHGQELQLKGVQFGEWMEHAEQELQKLLYACEKVYICGFSMGGLIGSWLASKYTVDRLVLLSAAALYINPKKFIKEMLEMATTRRNLCPTLADENFLRYKYKFKATPLSAYMQFLKLAQFVRPILQEIQTPTFIIQGKQDPIVPEKSAHYIYKAISAVEKKLLLLEEAKHQICYSHEQQRLFQEILEFLGETSHYEKIALSNL